MTAALRWYRSRRGMLGESMVEGVTPANVRRLALVIAEATDLVGIEDVSHGKRVALIASATARALRWAPAALEAVLDASLVHDLGVSSTRVHRTLVTELDWSGAREHCLRGAELLGGFRPLVHLAAPVQHHHTHWRELDRDVLGNDAALRANLVYLADRVDMLRAGLPSGEAPLRAEPIRERIAARSGDFFAPELVEAFLRVSGSEAFWLDLEPNGVAASMARLEALAGAPPLALPDLREFARLLAGIVDAKSHFTAAHSHGVARLSALLGALAGMSEQVQLQLEVAGLLHDVGKLQTPDEILDKPEPLDPGERARIRIHPYATLQVLRHLRGLGPIREWAAYHHESPDGRGYPFRLPGAELSTPARIVKVADVFQALAQARPYRPPMAPPAIVGVLREMAADRKLDPGLVELVAAHADACHAAAVWPSAVAA